MKIGSFQGISHAYFIRRGVQELPSMRNQKALNSYNKVQNSLGKRNINVREYAAAIVEISDEARDLAAVSGARDATVDGLIELAEKNSKPKK